MRILREAMPEIIGGLFVALVLAATETLRPQLRLPATGLALAFVGAILAGRRLFLTVRKRILRQKNERRYLNSVLTRYREWRQRYLELEALSDRSGSSTPEDVTLHPVMYLLTRDHEASGDDSARPAVQDRQLKVELSEAVAKSNRLVLLGEPGAGKSTCLQWLALKYAQAALERVGGDSRIPVLVALNRYTGQESASDFLKTYLLDEHGPSGAFLADDLAHYLQEGRLLLLFDGLNEMPGESYQARVDHLRSLAMDSHKCKVVVSCRTLDYDRIFSWPTLVIQRLNDSQLETFVANYLPDDGEELMRQLMGGDPTILDIARNPFMLRTMTVIYGRDRELPSARARLIDQFVKILVAREERDPWHGRHGLETATRLLANLALSAISEGLVGTAVDWDWAEAKLRTHMAASGEPAGAAPLDLLKLGADANLLDIPAGRDWVRYSHELIQEYLAALVLRDRWNAGDSLESFYEDCWWETTVTITCALISRPDDLVLSMLTKLPPDLGGLLAGRCCTEAPGQLDTRTRRTVLERLHHLSNSGLGPLAIRAMDLTAQIDYAAIERLVLQPDTHSPLEPLLQSIYLLGARHAPAQPLYLGPFNFATRDTHFDPRAYAASIARECGSEAIIQMLVDFLSDAQCNYRSSMAYVMAAGALADMAPAAASDLFVWLLRHGPPQVRAHAARGLGKMGAPDTLHLLAPILRDPAQDFGLRVQCAAAIANTEGTDALKVLLKEAEEAQLQAILSQEIQDREPLDQQELHTTTRVVDIEIEHLAALGPAVLLERIGDLFAGDSPWVLALPYPTAAALALASDESFIPCLKETLEPFATRHRKLAETIWWIEDAVRERRRRRGRTPQLSEDPRHWSAFGASPR